MRTVKRVGIRFEALGTEVSVDEAGVAQRLEYSSTLSSAVSVQDPGHS